SEPGTHPMWCPAEKDVARFQGHVLTDEGHEFLDTKHHIPAQLVLSEFAVDPGLQPDLPPVGDHVSGHEVRPHWGKGIQRFPTYPLRGWIARLNVARGDVVGDEVSGDRGSGVL